MDTIPVPTQATIPQQPAHPFWQHFSPRTLLLIIVLLFITGGLLFLAIRQEQPTRLTSIVPPSPTPSPAHSVLSLVPSTSSTSAIQSVGIVVDSHENQLTGAQINIAYDPKILSNVTIKQGTYFTNPTILLNTVDSVNGRISYVIAIGPSSKETTGSGTVATISYQLLAAHSTNPQQATTTKLTFLPKTEVTQQGVLGSVLKTTKDLTITIPQTLLLSPIPSATK